MADVADETMLRAPDPADVGGAGVVDLHLQAEPGEPQNGQVTGDDPVTPT